MNKEEKSTVSTTVVVDTTVTGKTNSAIADEEATLSAPGVTATPSTTGTNQLSSDDLQQLVEVADEEIQKRDASLANVASATTPPLTPEQKTSVIRASSGVLTPPFSATPPLGFTPGTASPEVLSGIPKLQLEPIPISEELKSKSSTEQLPITTQQPSKTAQQQPLEPLKTTQQPLEPPNAAQQPLEPPNAAQQPLEPVKTTQQPIESPKTTQQPVVPPKTTKELRTDEISDSEPDIGGEALLRELEATQASYDNALFSGDVGSDDEEGREEEVNNDVVIVEDIDSSDEGSDKSSDEDQETSVEIQVGSSEDGMKKHTTKQTQKSTTKPNTKPKTKPKTKSASRKRKK